MKRAQARGSYCAWLLCLLCRSASAELDEVRITAMRMQDMGDAPISTSVVPASQLELADALQARDLARLVTALTWKSSDGGSVGSIFLRGVGSPSIQSNQVGAIGLTIDGVSLLSPLFNTMTLFDLEQVEVTRGPQNAPFGRQASGGRVAFVTRKPQPGEDFGAELSLRAGLEEDFGQALVTQIPLGERAAARVSFAHRSRGDYIDNRNLGQKEGAFDRSEGRLSLAWLATDALDFDVMAGASDLGGESIRYKQVGLGTPGRPGRTDCPFLADDVSPGNGCVDQTGVASTRAFDENDSGHPGQLDARMGYGRFGVNLRGDDWEVHAITGYSGTDSQRAEDSDGGPSFIAASYQDVRTRMWSQELTMGGRRGDRIDWLAGLLYLEEDGHYTSARRGGNPLLTPILVPGAAIPEEGVRTLLMYGDLDNEVREFSLYGQMRIGLPAGFGAQFELRGSRTKLSGTQTSGVWADTEPEFPAGVFIGTESIEGLWPRSREVEEGALPQVCPTPFALTRCFISAPYSRRDDDWGGRLAIERRFGDAWMGYASLSRGYKAAGISPISRDAIAGRAGETVAPESVVTWEVGAKWDTPDRVWRAAVSLFHNDWDDYQLFLSVDSSTGPLPLYSNLPRARSQGGEAELEWSPDNRWALSAGVSLVDSEVVEVGDILSAKVGMPLPGIPRWSGHAQVVRHWYPGQGKLTARLAGSWSTESRFSLNGDPTLVEPGYGVLDATLEYVFGRNGRFTASMWGHNLTRESWCISRQSIAGLGAGDAVVCVPNEGLALAGVTLQVRFP